MKWKMEKVKYIFIKLKQFWEWSLKHSPILFAVGFSLVLLSLAEFNNVTTKTCLALGPDYSENLDKITRKLSLL